jgi:hypothetical protein
MPSAAPAFVATSSTKSNPLAVRFEIATSLIWNVARALVVTTASLETALKFPAVSRLRSAK